MTTCQSCGAESTVWLCAKCTTALRSTLEGVPRWLEALTDVVLRQTRIGNGGKRAKGDEMPALYQPHTTTAQGETRPTKQAQAAMLITAMRNDVQTWHRHVCESRGITWVTHAFIGPLLASQVREPLRPSIDAAAQWLADNAQTIACDEAAGECASVFEGYARVAERIVDLPTRRIWLGDCPTWDERLRKACSASLWAPEDAIEIRCPHCRQTHACDRLQLLLYNDLDRAKVTWEKILRANKSQPFDRQIPERTLQSWRATGRLKEHAYRRPNGRIVPSRHSDDDVPLYLWPDVRKLRDAKPQKRATGAAARKALA